MKTLYSITAAITIATSLVTISPANAGLGSAALSGSKKGYDAWCGKRGNDCKVVFEDGKITVDKVNSVDFTDITYITRTFGVEKGCVWHSCGNVIFGIEYHEKGMESREYAEILFFQHRNEEVTEKFWMDLKRACRNCKDRDATQVEVEVDIKE